MVEEEPENTTVGCTWTHTRTIRVEGWSHESPTFTKFAASVGAVS
jgi:hypothetical protein